MSWLQKLLPPRIKRDGSPRKVVPEGLWSKCESCEAVLYRADLEKNLYVCPNCNQHKRGSARERLDCLLITHLIGHEGEIGDDMRFRCAAANRLGVVEDFVERHLRGRFEPEHDHSHRIADEEHVDA